MRNFTNVNDIGDLKAAVKEALEVKANRFGYKHLGENKTLLMIFFNSSLRTRLSTQKAAMNLGMNVIVLDVNQGAWKLETERGVIMDGDKPEHLLEAVPVMGLRRHRRAVVRTISEQGRRLFGKDSEPIHQILRQTGVQHGSGDTPSAAKFCRPYHNRGIQKEGTPESGAHMGPASKSASTGRAQLFCRMDARCRL